MNAIGRKIVTAAVAVAATALIVPSAAAEADTTPPSVPQNLHDMSLASSGNAVLNWDPSTDFGTGVKHYWVLVDGAQRAKPTGTTYHIQDLVNLERITPGPHVITVLAVDWALNRSAPSAPINIVVVS